MTALQSRQSHPLRISVNLVAAYLAIAAEVRSDERFVSVPLHSRITHVQPMTGIVFWSTSEHNRTDAIQLEYSYMKYGDVVSDARPIRLERDGPPASAGRRARAPGDRA